MVFGAGNVFAQKILDIDSMRVFLPAQCNGTAILALPGGGYSHLAVAHEGYDWADFFNQQGIAYIVLRYRMPEGDKLRPISDVQKALAYIRSRAVEWGINPKKVGIMGSSAGGHLASTIATHSDAKTAPAFQILFYPVISMDERKSHAGSCRNFLGSAPKQSVIDLYSNDKQVTSATPPALILLCYDDTVVPPDNGIRYSMNMVTKGANAILLSYPDGGHGWGFNKDFKHHDEMLLQIKAWLRTLK